MSITAHLFTYYFDQVDKKGISTAEKEATQKVMDFIAKYESSEETQDEFFATVADFGVIVERKAFHGGLSIAQKLRDECNSNWEKAFEEDD